MVTGEVLRQVLVCLNLGRRRVAQDEQRRKLPQKFYLLIDSYRQGIKKPRR